MRVIRALYPILLLALAGTAAAQEPPHQEAPTGFLAPIELAQPEWGTADVSWVQVPAAAFLPVTSDPYASDLVSGHRRPLNFGNTFMAPIALPEGAKVVVLGVYYLDNNTNFSIRGRLVDCDFSGASCNLHPTPGVGNPDCFQDGWICSGNTFASANVASNFAVLEPAGIVVNNLTRRYHLTILVPVADGLMEIAGAVVGYRLQVSPAPATATFPNDVPTTHPYFRFIEALAAAGITAGCAPGSFCPNSPITRGEMAVFLAVALGLHWAPVIF